MAEEAKQAKSGSGSFVAWLLVVVLFGAVLWLASERNSRKWFLAVDGTQRTSREGWRSVKSADPRKNLSPFTSRERILLFRLPLVTHARVVELVDTHA